MNPFLLFAATFMPFVMKASLSSVEIPKNGTTKFLRPTLFNSPCNGSDPCEKEALLTCIAGLCQCESPSNQRFSEEFQICLSVVGGDCSLAKDNEEKKFPLRKCIPNAHCIEKSGYTECICSEGFIENSKGNCVPGLGQPCSYKPTDCNPLGMVVCKNGLCSCLDSLQIYDVGMKRCVSPAGTNCKYDTLQLGCVENAICYPFYYWVPPRCICKPGYHQTPDRKCLSHAQSHHDVHEEN